MPRANIHNKSSGVLCPVRLSITNSILNGGNSSGSVTFTERPSCQLFHSARFSSRPSTSLGGKVSRTSLNCPLSQGWSTSLVQFLIPLTRTSPVTGRNRVSSLAVPRRAYSWGRSDGRPSGSQLAPGYGIVW